MDLTQLHEDEFLTILWNEQTKIIGIDWKEATSAMTSAQFQSELTIFAAHVENKKAPAILVDVRKFRHKMEPGVEEWRVKNISSRYNAAGVKRFAFLLPKDAAVPSMMNQSAREEHFLTRGFNDVQKAENWLVEAGNAASA
jgi:hypothetical protein